MISQSASLLVSSQLFLDMNPIKDGSCSPLDIVYGWINVLPYIWRWIFSLPVSGVNNKPECLPSGVVTTFFRHESRQKESLWMCSCTVDGKILFQVFKIFFRQTCLEKRYYLVSTETRLKTISSNNHCNE